MTGHHLVMGTLVDFLTGDMLEDTHDERYRQEIARLLLEKKGYDRREVAPRCELRVSAGDRGGRIAVDFKIILSGRVGMIVKYGPGSLVTRHRPGLAIGRIMTPYQIPVVVVTNGRDADVLDGASGKPIGSGMDGIPDRRGLSMIMAKANWAEIPPDRAIMESRIVYCYEIDGACPCDTTVCRLA